MRDSDNCYEPRTGEMVARNFSMQELSYTQLLQVPDDENDFLTLEELKPQQQTQLGTQHYHQSGYYELSLNE